MEVECDLGKIIDLDGTSHGDVRVIRPQIYRMQYSGGKVAMHILGQTCVRPGPGCLLASYTKRLLTTPKVKFTV